MNIKTIKNDLRQLKKTIHIIDTMKETQERYLKRIETLSKFPQTAQIKDQIKTTQKVLNLLDIDTYIKEATEIEKKYMAVINRLDPIEKTIIIESFINGKPYWKIGMELSYAEETIRKKVDKILRKMVGMFNKG